MAEPTTAAERLEAKQRSVLMEMYYSLTPVGRLELVARLTGNEAIQSFLRDLALEHSQEELAIDKLRAEAEARQRITTSRIPLDAKVSIFLANYSAYEDCEDLEEVAELDYDRLLVLRHLGDERFKVIGQSFADGLEEWEDEGFEPDDVISLGTGNRTRKGGISIERYCRLGESLAIEANGARAILALAEDGETPEYIRTVVIGIEVNNEQVLPYTT